MAGKKHPDGIELRAIRPSAGVRANYQRRLDRLIAEMHRSLAYWLEVNYKRQNARLAMDANPAAELRAAMRRLARRWQRRFNEYGPKFAAYFAKDVNDRVDGELKAMIRDAGFSVRFKPSQLQRAAIQATIGENVALIKSIAERHLTNVEGIVLRGVSAGRDASLIAKELEENYGVTRRRAATIARTQNNMATATFTKVRQQELGVKKAVWRHSAGGKHPRPEHVAFNGKTYDIAKGAYLEGKWTWPGREINCRCVSVPILPGLEHLTPGLKRA